MTENLNPNSPAPSSALTAQPELGALTIIQRPPQCLICHWEPDEPNKGDHAPKIRDADFPQIYVCADCFTRNQTVDSFGLTVEELRIAAKNYRAGAESGVPLETKNLDSSMKHRCW